jgi:hypothetical protein
MGARFSDNAWGEPDTYPPPHGLLIRTGHARTRRRSRSGRVEEMPIVGVLRRVWIPPVILAVIGFGGVTVSLVRIVFASAQQSAGAGSHVDQVFSADLSAYAHCLGKSA